MKLNPQMIVVASIVVLSSVGAAAIMYAFDDTMSPLAFAAWAIVFAAPQLALLPSYKHGTCRVMDRLMKQKSDQT